VSSPAEARQTEQEVYVKDQRQRPVSGAEGLAAIYVRVSSKEQVEGYSLDAQRRACRDFCAGRSYTVVADYADEGVSAHTDNLAKRPDFSRMLADASSGRFSVIVVHKMDRFARKLRVALECLEQLGRAHVGVVSVSEPNLDYSTPQGFLFLSMLGALAEFVGYYNGQRPPPGTAAGDAPPGRASRRRRDPRAAGPRRPAPRLRTCRLIVAEVLHPDTPRTGSSLRTVRVRRAGLCAWSRTPLWEGGPAPLREPATLVSPPRRPLVRPQALRLGVLRALEWRR